MDALKKSLLVSAILVPAAVVIFLWSLGQRNGQLIEQNYLFNILCPDKQSNIRLQILLSGNRKSVRKCEFVTFYSVESLLKYLYIAFSKNSKYML